MPVPAGSADETDRSKHLEMDLVFELPAKGLPRHRRGQAEQDAAVELKRTEEAGFSLGGTVNLAAADWTESAIG